MSTCIKLYLSSPLMIPAGPFFSFAGFFLDFFPSSASLLMEECPELLTRLCVTTEPPSLLSSSTVTIETLLPRKHNSYQGNKTMLPRKHNSYQGNKHNVTKETNIVTKKTTLPWKYNNVSIETLSSLNQIL